MVRTIAMSCGTVSDRFGEIARTLPFLNRWSLSACQARRVFPANEGYRMVLNTDPVGAELLVDKLKLPFDEVVVDDLPKLPQEVSFLWSLSKASTYRLLSGRGLPFLHLDYDFKFWRKPRPEILSAPAFAQMVYACTEDQLSLNDRLPKPLSRPVQTCNAGVIGGNAVAEIHAAVCAGLAVATAPENRSALLEVCRVSSFTACSLVEETPLANAFVGRMLPFVPVNATHADWDTAGISHEASTKSDLGSVAQVEFRLFTEHPEQWRRTRDIWLSML